MKAVLSFLGTVITIIGIIVGVMQLYLTPSASQIIYIDNTRSETPSAGPVVEDPVAEGSDSSAAPVAEEPGGSGPAVSCSPVSAGGNSGGADGNMSEAPSLEATAEDFYTEKESSNTQERDQGERSSRSKSSGNNAVISTNEEGRKDTGNSGQNHYNQVSPGQFSQYEPTEDLTQQSHEDSPASTPEQYLLAPNQHSLQEYSQGDNMANSYSSTEDGLHSGEYEALEIDLLPDESAEEEAETLGGTE